MGAVSLSRSCMINIGRRTLVNPSRRSTNQVAFVPHLCRFERWATKTATGTGRTASDATISSSATSVGGGGRIGCGPACRGGSQSRCGSPSSCRRSCWPITRGSTSNDRCSPSVASASLESITEAIYSSFEWLRKVGVPSMRPQDLAKCPVGSVASPLLELSLQLSRCRSQFANADLRVARCVGQRQGAE